MVSIERFIARSVITIALYRLGHSERGADYFNQALLEDSTRHNDDAVTPKPQS